MGGLFSHWQTWLQLSARTSGQLNAWGGAGFLLVDRRYSGRISPTTHNLCASWTTAATFGSANYGKPIPRRERRAAPLTIETSSTHCAHISLDDGRVYPSTFAIRWLCTLGPSPQGLLIIIAVITALSATDRVNNAAVVCCAKIRCAAQSPPDIKSPGPEGRCTVFPGF